MNWNNYYMIQAGGGGSDDYALYRGSIIQKGYGLGSTFKKFFRWIVPIFQKHALPTIESGVKAIGKQTLSSVSDIAKDIVAGRNIRESAQERVSTAIDYLKQSAEQTLEGKGIKRKKKFKNYPIYKKQKLKKKFNYEQDIFS